MRKYLEIVEATLDEVLPGEVERPKELSAAMRYAVGTGGKRIRPVVCLAAAEAVGGRAEDAKYPAAAIELLHNYTLVHDDLPAMDNDVERRGKPTVWKRYGEANAILTGDALQALAFRVAAQSPRNAAEIVKVLGDKGVGVVQGQVEDVEREKGIGSREKGVGVDIPFIYEHKTADLFMAAAMMGALAGGGDAEQVEKLRQFGLNLGLAFQYEDDLLDGDSPYSADETRRLIDETTSAAIEALGNLPGDTDFLMSLAQKLVARKV